MQYVLMGIRSGRVRCEHSRTPIRQSTVIRKCGSEPVMVLAFSCVVATRWLLSAPVVPCAQHYSFCGQIEGHWEVHDNPLKALLKKVWRGIECVRRGPETCQ
jgi:hypothetical protein